MPNRVNASDFVCRLHYLLLHPLDVELFLRVEVELLRLRLVHLEVGVHDVAEVDVIGVRGLVERLIGRLLFRHWGSTWEVEVEPILSLRRLWGLRRRWRLRNRRRGTDSRITTEVEILLSSKVEVHLLILRLLALISSIEPKVESSLLLRWVWEVEARL